MRELPAAPGQPIVGLDFDGVLNVVLTHREPPPGYEIRHITLDRAHWPTHPYIAQLPFSLGRPVTHRVVVNPTHADMIRNWQAAGALVCWATTWELAILSAASECGIPELPVLEISQVIPNELPHRTADWKFRGLSVACAGHPTVWVDDFADSYEGFTQIGDPPAPLLVVAPDETVGLTAADSERIVQFVREHRRHARAQYS